MKQFEIDIGTLRDGFPLSVREVKPRNSAIAISTRQCAQLAILRLVFRVDRFKILKADDNGSVMRLYEIEHSQLLVLLGDNRISIGPSMIWSGYGSRRASWRR